MPHLLMLEDGSDFCLSLKQHLKREGFSIHAFGQDREALAWIAQSSSGHVHRLEVAMLDLTLPHCQGLEVLRAIRADRQFRSLPVVLVTAKAEEIDRVLGLELGADDYISKPFSSRELVARIRAILRRATFIEKTVRPQSLAFGPISVEVEKHQATLNGVVLDLTRREFELLTYFLQYPHRVLSREKILQQVWGLEFLGESRTIDAHVRRVRAKLGDSAVLIETVVGVGYRLGSVQSRT